MSQTQAVRRGMVVVASARADVRRRYVAALRGRVPVVAAPAYSTLVLQAATLPSAVTFLDSSLPGLGGLSGLPTLRRMAPGMKIVLIASTPNNQDAVVALSAGARGYCGSRLARSLIRKAADLVQHGQVWIGRRVIPYLVRQLTVQTRLAPADAVVDTVPALAPLTSREREVALLVGAGHGNKAIAVRLQITERTVKAHLTSTYRKLELQDRVGLALLVTGRQGNEQTHS